MYFRQKNYFPLNKKIDVSNFSKLEQLKSFHQLFDDFIKYHHKRLINENKIRLFKPKSNDYYDLKLSFRFEDKFRMFLNILDEIIKFNWSENSYFKNTKSKIKRSSWYAFKNYIIKLTNWFLNDRYFEWNNHLGKLSIKKYVVKHYNK